MEKKILIAIIVIISGLKCTFGQRTTIEKSGDVLYIALPSTAFLSTLIWRDGQKGTFQFIKSMGTSFLVTHALKRKIDKERPNGGRYSFPSGHTSSAFTGAAFIGRRYGWKAGLPAYLLAGYTAWTRIYANKHDYWDVLGGMAVGIGSAYLFTKPFKKSQMERINLSFGKSNEIYLVSIDYRF